LNGECLNDLAIAELQPADAPAVRHLIDADRADYRKFFVAFELDVAQLTAVLETARRDRYWGIRADGRLIGFFMLRGFDEGYAAPAFGVYVANSHAARGIGTLALQFAITWCRLNGCEEIMLSVHPDHAAAAHIYKQCGFQSNGELSARGHHIYRKKLS
jgi:RimJ/RimL family protein N-acetyltransferase